MSTIPVTKDTAPPEFVKMARNWLLDRGQYDKELDALMPPDIPFPDGWVEALAGEFAAAILDRGIEWVRTLKEGRPPTTYVVEWEARDLIPAEDALEVAAGSRTGE